MSKTAAAVKDKAHLWQAFLKDTGCKKTEELVALADLNYDKGYQRGKDPQWSLRISKEYERLLGWLLPILVARRPDGTLWVVDGQHRTGSLEKNGETHVWAIVVTGLTLWQESRLRAQCCEVRKQSPMQQHKDRSLGHIRSATRLDELLAERGVRVSSIDDPGKALFKLNTVTPLRNMLELEGEAVLTRVIDVLYAAWWHKPGIGRAAGYGTAVVGVYKVLFRTENLDGVEIEVDDARLVRVLTAYQPETPFEVARNAPTGSGGQPAVYAGWVIEKYNAGLARPKRLRLRGA